jgi:hypothetical protein
LDVLRVSVAVVMPLLTPFLRPKSIDIWWFGPSRAPSLLLAQTAGWRTGRACPLCPGVSDINLFRYCQGVIDLDAELSDRAFDLGMPE